MWRVGFLLVVACGGAPVVQVASAPVTGVAQALPHGGECRRDPHAIGWSPRELGGQDGAQCVGPLPGLREYARHYYDTGEYERAGDCFVAEYELSRGESLLFSAGMAYARTSRRDLARFYFQRYLQDAPNAPNADDVRRQIAEIDHP